MKQVRRTLAGLALAAALLTGSVFAAVPAAPEGSCVLDEANVLSERTEQAVNDLTIALDELNKIQSEGRAKRAAAEVELGRIEGELKQKLMELHN